eukprot:TRINITY_DN17704_c0_g1_i1.p1 TRINITY_DN17704_c0_g1~~TRINITY_DN17704_c0_g1_i1.p1  ORF type:complete len:136 (+),score=37.73 TRINITY_DN17704_c0_g1_i1:160-567(+)
MCIRDRYQRRVRGTESQQTMGCGGSQEAQERHHLVLTLTCQPDKRPDLIALFNDPKEGLAKTARFPGCLAIRAFEDQENLDVLYLYEEWDTKESQSKYMAMRGETGFLKTLTQDFLLTEGGLAIAEGPSAFIGNV